MPLKKIKKQETGIHFEKREQMRNQILDYLRNVELPQSIRQITDRFSGHSRAYLRRLVDDLVISNHVQEVNIEVKTNGFMIDRNSPSWPRTKILKGFQIKKNLKNGNNSC